MGIGIVKYLLGSVLSVIYNSGENCVLCNTYCGEEALICKYCYKRIQFYNKRLTIKNNNEEMLCYSAAYYNGVMIDIIKRLKYKSDFNCGEILGELLLKTIKDNNISYDVITSVPLHKKSLKTRGFNQGEFLAKYVSNVTKKPYEGCLKKVEYTKDQIGLDDDSRWENLSTCFKAINKTIIKNKKILLIDDVLTTGATAFSCSRELLKNGAGEVTILTGAKSRV